MITDNELIDYVEANISSFHDCRIKCLQSLKMEKLLKRKNPYLFRCKNILLADELVKLILEGYLSSQEETLFGYFLEGFAIFVNGKVYHGKKSSAEGIDLEFLKDHVHYIVSIKSAPHWGNSSQIKKMKDYFDKAKRILRTSYSKVGNIVAINGCCYGKESRPDKGSYFKYCGQEFWELIAGDSNLYTKLIQPLGYRAKDRNEEFNKEYARIINDFTRGFIAKFCDHGRINWDILVDYNSGSKKIKDRGKIG